MIEKVHIRNFKSIRDVEVKLQPINILVGPNGAGKSNFINFFIFLTNVVEETLASYTAKKGGAERILFSLSKDISELSGHIVFSNENEYIFELRNNEQDAFYFIYEYGIFKDEKYQKATFSVDTIGYNESKIARLKGRNFGIIENLYSYDVFHFHDVSSNSHLKKTSRIDDVNFLRYDGSNLPAIIYDLQKNHVQLFNRVEATIRLVAPFFDRFDLLPNGDYIRLNWRQKGGDMYMNASDLSDGTLRFIALATLLLQPNPPATILIDEPELGLHPYAITILAGLMKSISSKSQIIVSTQSVNLVNEFEAQDIIVVENQNNESTFRRLDENELGDWLQEYTIGELWSKNVFGGNP